MATKTRKNLVSKPIAKKNPDGQKINIITHKIDVRPFQRGEVDIPLWRRAMQYAESTIPRRRLLYDLYADVELDGHVEAVTGKRIDAVTTANWAFVDKEGKPVDAINDLIDSIGFDNLLKEIVKTRFWGYTILEPTIYQKDGSWEMDAGLIPRLNYRPEEGIVAYDPNSDDGINIREGIYARTVMEVGEVDDLGLYLKAAPYQILKRGGLGDWALFVQVFGNPLIDATWDGYDESQRHKLLDALGTMGAGGALVRPDGTTVQLIERSGTANGDLQETFTNRLNKEISKALLGSTETTEASTASGYAQSKTHEGQDERKMASDIAFTRRVLNSRFIRIMQTAGIETMGGHFIVQGEENELTQKESFEIHKGLIKELGLPVDHDWLYEHYNIPKPDNYQEQIKGREQQAKAPPSPPAQPGWEDPEASDEVKLSYWQKLMGFFGLAPAPTGANQIACCGYHHTIELADKGLSGEPNYPALFDQVKKAGGEAFFYPELFLYNIQVLTRAFEQGYRGDELIKLADVPLGFTYNFDDPNMALGIEMNLFKFSTTKAAYQSREVNELFRRSKNFSEFERAVRKAFGVKNKRWLETEYNTAYQTGQSIATFNRLIKQVGTFPFWQYKTIGDGRVRESHKELHDAVFPVYVKGNKLNPVWNVIYPPNGWNCRCYVVPRLKGEVTQPMLEKSMQQYQLYLASDEFAKSQKQGFAINRANTIQVFEDSQHYVKNYNKVLEDVSQMTAKDWSLPDILLRQKQLGKAEFPINESRQVIQEWWESLEKSGAKGMLKDYAGREIKVEMRRIKEHTDSKKTKYNYRHPFLFGIQDALQSPDEVFVQNHKSNGFDTIRYFRYYENAIIEVAVLIKPNTLQLTLETWFDVKTVYGKNKTVPVERMEQNRKGLLVKAK